MQELQVARRELVLGAAMRRLHKFHLLITANQPVGEWDPTFPEQAMTLAAIDRLVRRASIFELNVESRRPRAAVETKRRRLRVATKATPANINAKLPHKAPPMNQTNREDER